MSLEKLRGTQLYIKIGDGNSPEQFAHPCLINSKRGIKFSTTANKEVTPDCDNPDDPAWNDVMTDGLSATVDGAGKLDNKPAVIAFYFNWLKSGEAKNVQVELGAVGGKWDGQFKLTAFELSGDRNVSVDVTLTMESHGPVDYVAP